jgi:hypothetical protein
METRKAQNFKKENGQKCQVPLRGEVERMLKYHPPFRIYETQESGESVAVDTSVVSEARWERMTGSRRGVREWEVRV